MHAIGVLALTGALAFPTIDAEPVAPTRDIPPDHPLIGTWLLSLDVEDPPPPSVSVFEPSGTVATDGLGPDTGFGVWDATGELSGWSVYTTRVSNQAGAFLGIGTFWTTLRVSTDGNSVHGGMYMAIPRAVGEAAALKGPFPVSGKRLVPALWPTGPRQPPSSVSRRVTADLPPRSVPRGSRAR